MHERPGTGIHHGAGTQEIFLCAYGDRRVSALSRGDYVEMEAERTTG